MVVLVYTCGGRLLVTAGGRLCSCVECRVSNSACVAAYGPWFILFARELAQRLQHGGAFGRVYRAAGGKPCVVHDSFRCVCAAPAGAIMLVPS